MQQPDPIDAEIERARDALHLLGKTVMELLKPLPGPYAFFHHNGHPLAALKDCTNILAHLRQGRAALSRMHAEQRRLPENDTKPDADGKMPAAWNEISNCSNEIAEPMKLDLESLYVFDPFSLPRVTVNPLEDKVMH